MSAIISETIDSLIDCHTFQLPAEIYVESVVVARPVTIAGSSEGSSVIISPPGAVCLMLSADAVIQRVTLRATQGKPGFAVEVVNGQPRLENCQIETQATAVKISGAGSRVMLRGCVLETPNFGLLLFDGAHVTLEDCEIRGAKIAPVLLQQGTSLTARQCRFAGTQGGGILIDKDAMAHFEQCEFADNPSVPQAERRISHAHVTVIGGEARFDSCYIRNGSGAGIILQNGGQCSLTNCRIESNTLPGLQLSAACFASLTACSINRNLSAGISIDGGSVTAVDCEIANNGAAGVVAKNRGRFEISQSRLSGNIIGAYVAAQGSGLLLNCDLSGNRDKSAFADPGSQLDCPGTSV